MDSKKTKQQILSGIRMTMKREDIMTFVSGLHDLQMDMIETVAVSYTHLTLPTNREV